MIITESTFDPKSILGPADELARYGDANTRISPRSPGLHLSQIYQDIEQTIDPRDDEDKFTPQELEVYRSLGFLWERALASSMADGISGPDLIRPGEFTCDGIIGSPDLIDQTTWTIVETKATWRSAAKLDNLHKYFWFWLVQMQGYAKMVDTNRARLVAFFVNGDYRPPKPCIRVLNFEFTRREVEDNWAMLTGHARIRGWLI